MKKFFAVLSILIFALALTSCGLLGMRGETINISSKPDTLDEYYSALNINLVSYLVATDDGQVMQYELQIGLRSMFFGSEEKQREQEIQSFADKIVDRKIFDMQYIGSYESEPLWDNDDSKNNYTYLCFVINPIHGKGKFTSTKSDFGFFFIEREYVITNPVWIESFRDNIYSHTKNVLGSRAAWQGYTIDDDAVYFSYGFSTEADVNAENAIWVQKNVLSRGQDLYRCLMWEADKDYDFVTFNIHYKSMASGWYVIAIILGAAVVVALFLFIKYKKTPAKVAEGVSGTDSGFNKDNDDIFQLESENAINVIDGQISIEEYATGDHTETTAEQTTDKISEDSNAD